MKEVVTIVFNKQRITMHGLTEVQVDITVSVEDTGVKLVMRETSQVPIQ